MNIISKIVVLCLALASPLTQAQDISQSLRLRDPLADALRTPLQVMMGVAVGAVVGLPAAYAGFQLGDRALPAELTCDHGVCDSGYPFGAVYGLLTGSLLGLSLGTGLGVVLAGSLQGGAFHWQPALAGSAVGAVLALTGSVGLGFLVGSSIFFGVGAIVVPALMSMGAVIGSVWWYQASLPFGPPASESNVAPMVRLVPGGGVVGIAGTL